MDTNKATAIPGATPPASPIEELPLPERMKIAEKFIPFEGITQGWLIDAKDTVNNWCVAEVQKVSANDLYLAYDGWSAKYDDWLKIRSSKVAPFRMFSKGYTGQVKVPLRRLTFSLDQLAQRKAKLEEVLATKFACLTTAFEVTQYLRGHLYIYVDFLMANEYKEPDTEIPFVIDFLKLVIKLIVLWLDLFPKHLRSFCEYQMYPRLYLVDRNVALAACEYEIIDMLRWLFCLNHRTLVFFCRYDVEVEKELKKYTKNFEPGFSAKREKEPSIPELMEKLRDGEEMVFGMFINFFNLFCEIGGLQSVLDIVLQERLLAKAGEGMIPGYKLPLEIIARILSPFKGTKSIALPAILKPLVDSCKTTFLQRVQSLDPNKDIKDINKESVTYSLEAIKDLLKLQHTEEEAHKIVETHEMLLSLKFIQSPYLEKRLQGIAEIRKMIERVEPPATNQRFMTQPLVLHKPPWFTSEYLAKWILNNKILDIILGEGVHPELIKRTTHILAFLAKKDMLTNELLDLLWKCQQDKHEDIVRVVYDTIKDILGYLKLEQIRLLFNKLKAIPLELCDEKLINFMKEFTLKAFSVHSFYDKLKVDPKKELSIDPTAPLPEVVCGLSGEVLEPTDPDLYFVPTFWALIQDETHISQALTDQAIAALKECIRDPHCAKYYPQYFNLCIQNIRKHRSVKQSLALTPYIVGAYNAKRVMGPRLLRKDYAGINLVTIILDDCEYYEKVVREKVGSKDVKSDIGEKVFVGKYNHLTNLEARFKFLEQVLAVGPEDLKMGKENLNRMWELFVENSYLEFDTKVFLGWISAEKETTTGVQPIPIFKPDENLWLFDMISKARTKMADTYGYLYFRCFAKHFKLVNQQAHSIALSKSKVFVRDYTRLIGIDPLWENATYNSDESTRGKFSELLVDVYLNQSESSVSQKHAVASGFIDRCMSCIMKNEDERTITNLVKLLLLFIETLDGAKYVEHEAAGVSQFPVSFIQKPGNGIKKLELPLNVTVGQIRKKAADLLGLPFTGFQMLTRTKSLGVEDDDTQYREIGWSDQITIARNVAADECNFKAILSQNQTYINHLFVLLSKETTTYIDPVWDLLMMLPPNQKMQSDIESLNLPNTAPEAWDTLLDSTSIHKLLYALQIVEKIMAAQGEPQALEKRAKWIEQFSKKGGLTHLFYALLKLPTSSLNRGLTRKCFALLIRLLATFQAENRDFERDVFEYEKNRGKLVERILTILEAFAQHSILPPGEKEVKIQPKEKPQQIYKTKEAPAPRPQQEETKTESQTLVKKRNKQIEESRTFDFGFKLIKARGAKGFFDPVAKFPKLKDLLLKGLILTDNRYMQYVFSQELQNICGVFKDIPYSETHPHVVLIPLMVNQLIRETLAPETKCMQFYKTLCNLIDGIPRKNLEALPVNYHEILVNSANLIKIHEVRENTSTDTDYALVGLMTLIEALLKKFPIKKALLGADYGLVTEVLKCLLEYPTTGGNKHGVKGLPPKCKSQSARLAAFSLLCVLARDTPQNLSQIINYLLPIHINGSWRTKRLADWCIAPEITEKSTTGYVGLKNLGCTCYMNSLIQQLYMIHTFRNDVLAVEDPDKVTPPDENLLFQTQCLFAALNQSVKQYYNPKLFCNAFKDLDKKPINVLEQMDVDEFFNLFMERIEALIKETPQKKTIQYHFGGLFANQFIGKECPHCSSREEPFLALNLQVKNKRSLQQCLESFVEGEMLQGSDAYYCEKCDKKVSTLKRVCIKKLPRYLICVLKRFEFNYDTMQKFKVNDYCEFPMRLNMEDFTEEGLARKDKEKERKKAEKEGRDIEEDTNSLPKPYPPEYYEYKLTGVLIHIGTAEAGHYYSLIMDREKDWLDEKDRWYEFNDALVNQYDLNDLKEDAFGGDERSGYEAMSSVRGTEKSRNAYLLVYERIQPYDPPEEDENEVGVVGQKGEPIIAEGIRKAVLADNVKYWHNKFMFNEDYFEFAEKLCLKWNSSEDLVEKYPSKNMDYHLLGLSEEVMKRHAFQTGVRLIHVSLEEVQNIMLNKAELKELELLVFKYATTFLLTTLFRSRQKSMLPDFMDLVKAFLNKHPEASQWLIWQFTNSKVLGEFLIENSDTEICRFVAGLLYCAMLKTFEVEKSQLLSSSANCVLPNFANCLLNQLGESKKRPSNVEFFFQVIARMAYLGPEAREYLLRVSTLKRLIGYWKAIPDTSWNNYADISFKENTVPELGLPSEVDERFRSPFEEFFNLRKEQLYQQYLPINTFLFDALGALLRGATCEPTTLASPLSLPILTKGIGIDLITKSLLQNSRVVQAIIKEAKSSIAILSISKGLAHLAWETMDFAKPIAKGIIQGINEVEWDEFKKHFYVLRTLLDMKSPTQKTLIDYALSELDLALKAQQKAFYATLFAIDYIQMLVTENPMVEYWYHTHTTRWEWLLDWLKNNPVPSLTDPMATVKPYKSKEQNEAMLSQFAYTSTDQIQNAWRVRTEESFKLLSLLKEGKHIEQERRIEIRDCVYFEKFFVRQVVEQLDARAQNWNRAVIMRVLDEMLQVRPEDMSERYAEWIEVDSDKLALEGTNVKDKDALRNFEDSDESPMKDSDDDENDMRG